jgi:hypothetical protein
MNQHSKKNRTNREEVELNNYTSEQLLRFPLKVNNKFDIPTKNYEVFNIVSENGDSIYAPQYDELAELLDDDSYRGQIFVSETAIEEIVNRIIDQKRLGPSVNNAEDV